MIHISGQTEPHCIYQIQSTDIMEKLNATVEELDQIKKQNGTTKGKTKGFIHCISTGYLFCYLWIDIWIYNVT